MDIVRSQSSINGLGRYGYRQSQFNPDIWFLPKLGIPRLKKNNGLWGCIGEGVTAIAGEFRDAYREWGMRVQRKNGV